MSISQRPVALISGSGTGIGAAIAQALSKQGWNVVINYSRSAEAAKETAIECQALGAQTLLLKGSVAEDADCRAMAEQTLALWGRIDAVVNCAGVTMFAPFNDLEAIQKDDFERIFGVNVVGGYQLIRSAQGALKQSPIGAVVNISSAAGFTGVGSSSAYAASKGALNTLTKSLALALAPNVRVNSICPGYVDTRWGRGGMDEEQYQRFIAEIAADAPLHKVVNADEVAKLALFLIKDATSMTGDTFLIDAGAHLVGDKPMLDE